MENAKKVDKILYFLKVIILKMLFTVALLTCFPDRQKELIKSRKPKIGFSEEN